MDFSDININEVCSYSGLAVSPPRACDVIGSLYVCMYDASVPDP